MKGRRRPRLSRSWFAELLDGDLVFMGEIEEYWYGMGFWV